MNNLSINHVHLNLCLTCLKGTNRWHRPHLTCHYYTRASMSAHTFGLGKGLCLIANRSGNIPGLVYSCAAWGCRWECENDVAETQLHSGTAMEGSYKSLRHSPGHLLFCEEGNDLN